MPKNSADLTQRELKNVEQVLKSVGIADIENIDPQVFSDMVLRDTRANLIMRETAADVNRELVGSAGSTIDYREIGALTAEEKPEFQETSEQTLDFPAVRVEVAVQQALVPISDEAMEDGNLDTPQAIAEEIGVALARKNDQEAYDLVTDTDYSLDELKYGSAETLSDYAYEETLDTAGEITFQDMADLAGKMREDDQPVDTLVVSEQHAHKIVQQDLFHLANERGDQVGRMEGRIGRVLRMDVYVTSQANGYSGATDSSIQGVMLSSDRAFVEAVKREPRIELRRHPREGFDSIVGTMRYGHEIYDAEGVGWLRNPSA